jgi:hypothetical protein
MSQSDALDRSMKYLEVEPDGKDRDLVGARPGRVGASCFRIDRRIDRHEAQYRGQSHRTRHRYLCHHRNGTRRRAGSGRRYGIGDTHDYAAMATPVTSVQVAKACVRSPTVPRARAA